MASEHQAISQHQVEQEETTIDLAELFYRLLDKAKFIIVAALLGAIIAFCVTKFFMTPMYQASAKLYVLNSSGTSLNLSQIQLSSSLASDYVQVFDNWHVHEMVKRRLNLDYTYAQMGKMISVENPTNTRILKVTVQSDDPQEAADMALTYVQVAREFIAAKMDMDMPTIFEEPQLPTRPYSPSTMKNTVLGFLLGLLLMCGIVVVQFLADDRVRNADKLENATVAHPKSKPAQSKPSQEAPVTARSAQDTLAKNTPAKGSPKKATLANTGASSVGVIVGIGVAAICAGLGLSVLRSRRHS